MKRRLSLLVLVLFLFFSVLFAQSISSIKSVNDWLFVAAMQSADTNLTQSYIAEGDATQGTHYQVFKNYGIPDISSGPGYIQLDVQWAKQISRLGYYANPDSILFDITYMGSVNAQMLFAKVIIQDETGYAILQPQLIPLTPGWKHISIWSSVAALRRVANLAFDFSVIPPDSSFCGVTFGIDNIRFLYIKNGIPDTVLIDGCGDSVITGITDKKSSLPTHYALYQNYPNPFNPSTTINYALSSPGDVTLSIYDILGRKITDLVSSSYQSTGNHSVVWNAFQYPSGVYIYTLSVNGKLVDRKKMLFLK
ncbi:MAG: T9SS type A sorting domain-containing protein [Ignavibacteriaceae bacterium]